MGRIPRVGTSREIEIFQHHCQARWNYMPLHRAPIWSYHIDCQQQHRWCCDWRHALASNRQRKEDGSYFVEITKSKQFLLVTHYVGRGMSFAMAADAIHDAKKVCDIPKLGACSDYLVTSYARVACALLIEHISQVLCSKWAFSVAFDVSTDHYITPFSLEGILHCRQIRSLLKN